MSINPYQKSTEHLTAKMPKLTREQALKLVRGPALGLISVSGLTLALAFAAMLGTAGYFGLKLLTPDDTEMEYHAPNKGESKTERMAREARATKMAAESNFISLSTAFLVSMAVILVNAIVLTGAIKMRALQKYRFASAAASVAIIPLLSPLFIVGIPFGIWAKIKLGNPEVKRYFTN